jgi:uncharacterized protein YcfJ
MALCRYVCIGVIGIIGIVTIVVLTMGDSGNAYMTAVDKEAIKESKANSLRIRQGGFINITGFELNSDGGILDWHIGALVSGMIAVVMGSMVAWGMWRRWCRRINHTHAQDIEMQQE